MSINVVLKPGITQFYNNYLYTGGETVSVDTVTASNWIISGIASATLLNGVINAPSQAAGNASLNGASGVFQSGSLFYVSADGVTSTAVGSGLSNKVALTSGSGWVPFAQQVMASPPTCTLTTAHTIASAILWPATSGAQVPDGIQIGCTDFTLSGAGNAATLGTTYPNYFYLNFTSVNYAVGNLQFNSAQASFMHDGSALELWFKGTSGYFLVKINGQYITLTPTQVDVTNSGVAYYYYIPFGSADRRRIDVLVTGNTAFGGVYTAATDTIEQISLQGPRTIIVGDSFVEGQIGNGTSISIQTWSRVFADAMGWDDVWQSGVGGTGFLATNSGTRNTYRQRLATDVIPFNPDIVIFEQSINDSAQSAAAIIAEATLTFNQLKSTLHNCLIVVTSPMAKGGVSTTLITQFQQDAAMQSLVASYNGLYLPLLTMPLTNATPSTITLSSGSAQFATSLTGSQAIVGATYQWSDGSRSRVKTCTGAGPNYTITLDAGIANAQSIGAVATQVGSCLWTGTGYGGATTGYGNSDIYVGSDHTHPSPSGHAAIGKSLAMSFINSYNKFLKN